MTAPTAGQVFRETLHERWTARGRRIDLRPWEALPEADRADLDAAAQAAREPLLAIITQIIAHWEYVGTTREDDELIAGWRERAGLPS